MYNETNNYCETLVQRHPDQAARRSAALYLVLAAITAVLGLTVNLLFFLVTVACVVFRTLLLNKANVEFEYQFWGRQLDVDVIEGGAKRRQLVSYQMDDVDIVARPEDPAMERYLEKVGSGSGRTRDLTDRDPNGVTVYQIYVREGAEMVSVLFQPSHEMLRQMWRIAPNRVHIPKTVQRDPEEDS